MTTRPEETGHEYVVKVFGEGDYDRGCDGSLNSYPYIARRFTKATEKEAVAAAKELLAEASRINKALYAGEHVYTDGWATKSEWCGAAVYHKDEMIWSEGWTFTDEEIAYARL